MSIYVLLATYNGADFIAELMDSVRNQKVMPDAIIHIDDGSQDDSVAELKRSIGDIELISITDGARRGPRDAFFKLMECCSEQFGYGDIFIFCDQDDIWHEEKIQKSFLELSPYLQDESPVFFSSMYQPFEGTIERTYHSPKPYFRKEFGFVDSLLWNPFHGCTMAFNYSALRKAVEFGSSSTTMHDRCVAIVCFIEGKFIFCHEILTFYRLHENNTVGLADGLSGLKKRLRNYRGGYFEQNLTQMGRAESYCAEAGLVEKSNLAHTVLNAHQNIFCMPMILFLPFRAWYARPLVMLFVFYRSSSRLLGKLRVLI